MQFTKCSACVCPCVWSASFIAALMMQPPKLSNQRYHLIYRLNAYNLQANVRLNRTWTRRQQCSTWIKWTELQLWKHPYILFFSKQHSKFTALWFVFYVCMFLLLYWNQYKPTWLRPIVPMDQSPLLMRQTSFLKSCLRFWVKFELRLGWG